MRRVKQSFAICIAILLAGLYGIYSHFTSEVPLAAFTIAYISGGAVFGANMITSLSRAMGTVTACVFTLIVLQIIVSWTDVDRFQNFKIRKYIVS
jgi:hypothetical protein